MITQSIKHWLRKMFVWWPWRQTPPMEYNHVSGPLNEATPEGVSLSTIEGTAPQTSVTPRLSTIGERPDCLVQTPSPAANDLAETPVPPSLTPPVDTPGEPNKEDISPAVPSTPTPQQRLEFLRYLVERGIVNEGK